MRDHVQSVLDTLRQRNGLYVASPSSTYHYVWIRDICYIALSELKRDNGRFEQTYHALFDILKKYRWKLAYHAKHRPNATYEYIHPRYTAETLEEVMEPWGNAQNDAIGAFLYGVGEGLRRGKTMLRDDMDREIVRLLVRYLSTLRYWRDEDNGMWEENQELHASSVGACIAGLLSIQPYFPVDWGMIQAGLTSLYNLLPAESPSKNYDLAELSLIYPYRLLPRQLAEIVLANVETGLARTYGVIRYEGDEYYAENGREAEWCMGFPWLGLCHFALGNREKASEYLQRTEDVMTKDKQIPELYLAESALANENTPLGWSHSLYLVLYDALHADAE